MSRSYLQKLMFPDSDCAGERELYYRTDYAGNLSEEDVLEIVPDSRVDFNTYFNSFSCMKWSRYTGVSSVCIQLEISGGAEISLYHNVAHSGKCCSRTVKTVQIPEQEKSLIELDFGEIETNGSFSFSVLSKAKSVRIYGGAYFTKENIELNDIKLALIFTTYKREAYIKRNLNLLEGRFENRIHTYIVDNGSSLNLDPNAGYTVIPNSNVGGAGGFACGMIQVIDEIDRDFTHCVLMDDDILISPDVLDRLLLFLSHISREYRDSFVGGAMLRMDIPFIQSESGGIWNGVSTQPFGFGTDLRRPYECLINEFDHRADYNAWWFCVIPIRFIRNDNLPLPIFVFNDDVDYGLRNQKNLILMNGLCIWHEPFDSKFSASRIYYQTRNTTIVSSVHNTALPMKAYLKKIQKQIEAELIFYRYSNADCIIAGVLDFLNGPKWLSELDAEAYHTKILSYDVKTKSLPELQMTNRFDQEWYQFCTSLQDMNILKKIYLYLKKGRALFSKNKFLILPIYTTKAVNEYKGAGEILFYDEINKKGLITRPDPSEDKRIRALLQELNTMIRRKYTDAVEEYKKAYPWLCSREQWNRYLGLK